MEDENQTPIQTEETVSQTQEPSLSPETPPSPEEPIVLSKLFPQTDQDLDTLFPDPQMKKLLKEVHRTQQSNQRFLKKLNLSKIPSEEEPPAESS